MIGVNRREIVKSIHIMYEPHIVDFSHKHVPFFDTSIEYVIYLHLFTIQYMDTPCPYIVLVGEEGFEPSSLAAYGSKPYMYSSSITRPIDVRPTLYMDTPCPYIGYYSRGFLSSGAGAP